MFSKWKLAYPKEMWILAIAAVISSTGSSFLWPLNTIYMTQELGRSISISALVLMGYAGSGVLGSLLGGYLHDRIGGKITVLIGTFMSCLCLLGLASFREWIPYIIIMALLGFSNGIYFPALYALVKGIWPEGGRKGFNLLYISQNLGVALGSAMGGIVAQKTSFSVVFIVNALAFVIFFIIIAIGISKQARDTLLESSDETAATAVQSNGAPIYLAKSTFPSLMILCFGFMFCLVIYVQWTVIIPTYMKQLGLSISSYSLLWTINGVLILIGSPLIALLTRRTLSTLKSQMVTGVIFFMICLVTLNLSSSYAGFMIGMMVITCGEIFLWPVVPTAASELAPPGKNGIYQGMVNGFSTFGRMIGPLVGGLLFENYNFHVLVIVLMLICCMGLICFLIYDRGKLRAV
ncbi:MFS transporter [Paenibacillus sp. GP183]|jgi:predicted MFS family arabinose efflux permease|uniref:MDR family MFS transporter n=1 Tax=Paenibacillus sp. GP183 TaxID=1882751 RepID=UPI0008990BE8|nr:MFS transporter [Paenibacillus sp. GP183]SEB97352.1 Predicted arabinose efflux permease, MFS family [Paenibacillus sp. GP183]